VVPIAAKISFIGMQLVYEVGKTKKPPRILTFDASFASPVVSKGLYDRIDKVARKTWGHRKTSPPPLPG